MKEYINKVNSFDLDNKTKDLIIEQIKLFDSYRNNKSINNYHIGDKVILNSRTLIHGSRIKINELENIAKKD